jgi:hypothetical protein
LEEKVMRYRWADLKITDGPTREEIAAALASQATGTEIKPLTFTTKDGKSHDLILTGCEFGQNFLYLHAKGSEGLTYDPETKKGSFFEDI